MNIPSSNDTQATKDAVNINSERLNDVVEVSIKCPNCKMLREHKYIRLEYTPLFGKCGFCGTLWKWSKSKCREIIPAASKQYLTINHITNSANY